MTILFLLAVGLAAFMGWMAKEEYGDRESWSLFYIILAAVCALGAVAIIAI